jgi:peptide-methionine (R)-S-oxide reductase
MWWRYESFDTLPSSETGDEVSIIEFSADGVARGPAKRVPRVTRAENEWWSRLTPQQFYVTRHGSTDPSFSGTYFSMHSDGLFHCVCCGNALFSSDTKYDSGTGWPAFRAPVAIENVRIVETTGLSREAGLQSGIEALCKLCDAHLGHIFGDGPAPGRLRYCINESALRFEPKS